MDCHSEAGLVAALELIDPPRVVFGGGTNLVVSDDGYAGSVIRYGASAITEVRLATGSALVADSGTELDRLVEYTVDRGLAGMECLRRIPGWVGGAVYGNAGAYGQQISDWLVAVRIHDGVRIRELTAAECGFVYRGSIFKQHKNWVILSAAFQLPPGDRAALAERAEKIRATRDAKFPPSMKCAGSVFKNLHVDRLPAGALARVPEQVIQHGKVPAAWFLEQVGAKGRQVGGMRVADYHANLVYNDGQGTAGELVVLIDGLKAEVAAKFGFFLEEELQFVGFPTRKSF